MVNDIVISFLKAHGPSLPMEIGKEIGYNSFITKAILLELINKGQVASEGLLNMVEMAFRAYDPCMACATHTLPGQMPLEVVIRDSKGNVIDKISQYLHSEPLEVRVIVP